MSDGLRVGLATREDVVASIMDRAHWIVVFGRSADAAIDALDQQLGIYPTFPTVMQRSRYGLHFITIIPKSKVSRQRMIEAVSVLAGETAQYERPDQDIFMVAGAGDEPAMVMFLNELVGDAQSC